MFNYFPPCSLGIVRELICVGNFSKKLLLYVETHACLNANTYTLALGSTSHPHMSLSSYQGFVPGTWQHLPTASRSELLTYYKYAQGLSLGHSDRQ